MTRKNKHSAPFNAIMQSWVDTLDGLLPGAFNAKEDVYAVIRPDQKKLGQIKEISGNGITFQYFDDHVDEGESGKTINHDEYRVDIFIRQNGYFIRDLPIHHLSESTVPIMPSFCRLPMRMVKIRFAELAPSQKQKLAFLAARYSFSF
jgi:hypothetical protein